jgi:dTDP-4-dehydrorhamnose 3,5-epimerase
MMGNKENKLSASSQASTSNEHITVIGKRHSLELAILRRPEKTLGKIVTQVSSPDLINGVIIEPLQIFADDRGFFAELARLGQKGIGEGMIADGKRRVQISTTLTYPGTIKAIHYHYEQTDLWAPISGMLQVFLYDFRRGSATFGQINTLYVGRLRPWEILIPPGVAHGYKVLGMEPAQLVYLTDRYYNPEDEGRLPYDHPDIAYDWETQHK